METDTGVAYELTLHAIDAIEDAQLELKLVLKTTRDPNALLDAIRFSTARLSAASRDANVVALLLSGRAIRSALPPRPN